MRSPIDPTRFLQNRMLEADVYDFVFQSPSEEKMREMATSSQIHWGSINPEIQSIYNLLKSGIRYEEFINTISPAFRDSGDHEEIIYRIMTVYNTYRSVMPQLFPGLCLVLAINITYEAALQKRTKGQMDDTQERIG